MPTSRNDRLAAIALREGMVDPIRLARVALPFLRATGVGDWLQFFMEQGLLSEEQAERLRNAYAAAEPPELDAHAPAPESTSQAFAAELTPPPVAPTELSASSPRHVHHAHHHATDATSTHDEPHGHPPFEEEADDGSEASAHPSPNIAEWMLESDTLMGEDDAPTHVGPHLPGPRSAHPHRAAVVEASRRAGVSLTGATPPTFPAERKYTLSREVGRGGVARVFEAIDHDIGRRVAIKVLREPRAAAPRMLEKLIEEAQITGQLEHPNIVPVHDLGLLPSGEVFFAMKLVRGRPLSEILRQIRAGREEVAKEFSRLRLLTFFQQICMAISFAHERGVIHRDLKPDNILIGDHGEVSVMDWGLARVVGRKERQSSEDMVRTLRSEGGGTRTVVGTISGTPSYMPPEQAMGNVFEIDPRSDVYSLGAMLYEILALVPPFTGRDAADILTRVVADPVVPPSVRSPERGIPAELEEICLRALSKKREDRYPSARHLHDEVDLFLEGTRERLRKRAEASLRITIGHDARVRYTEQRDEMERLTAAAREAERKVKPWAAAPAKRRLWELEDLVVDARSRLAETFASAVEAYSQALGIDPDAADARDALAELYFERLDEAETRGEPEGALHFRTLLGQFAGGRYAGRLSAAGHLTLHTQPPGARVVCHRYRERNRVLTLEEPRELGVTPTEASLPPGSYLLQLEHPGRVATRLPIVVQREARLHLRVPLKHREEVGDGFVYIPAGSYLSGGDPLAPTATPRRSRHVRAFAIGEYPVTVGEYLAFINDLARVAPGEAQRRTPRATATSGFYWTARPDQSFTIESPDPDGDTWDERWPAMGISWQDAAAYCAWYSRRIGATVRLPTRDEWEKAARGVDGRLYPWGDHFDPTFCKMETSKEGRPLPEPVGRYPFDESPYGVRELAGTVMEWSASRFMDDEHLRTLCGGSWRDPALLCRATWETGATTSSVSLSYGFRLVRTL